MQGRVLVLVSVMLATACATQPQSSASPTPAESATVPAASIAASPTLAASTPTQTPTAAPTATVARTISGKATMSATGAGVAGVRVRAMPSPLNDGRISGPDLTAVTDDRGAYTVSVVLWTAAALGGSSSVQLMVQVTPPPGLLVLAVSSAIGGPPGSASGNLTSPLMVGDLNAPIDITLGSGHIVEGRITDGNTGTPQADTRVVALGMNSMLIYGGQGDAFEIVATATTDAAGRYKLTVPPGTYVVQTTGHTISGVRFWSDDPAVFQATPLKVERDVTGIDIAVVVVTQLSGQVRTGPSFGDGLQGARVAAYLAGGAACCRLVGVAMTSVAGMFLMHVPPGSYRLVIDPPAGSPYAAQWWRAASGFASATDVNAFAGPMDLEVELTRRP
ncbi:MAG TPA: hypothetical protein VI056_00575 [Candidatus Limnocylindria bacterium]